MWIIINDALLTNYAHVRRGLVANDTCVLSGISSETMLHTLRDYSKVKEMRKNIGNSFIKDSYNL